jgi:hypothetical protein
VSWFVYYQESESIMKTIKVSGLSGAALDWAVAKCEGHTGKWINDDLEGNHIEKAYSPSTDWAQGGPIIEENGITLVNVEGDWNSKRRMYDTFWIADEGQQCHSDVYGSQGDHWGNCYQIDKDCITGATPLIAAMRCYLAVKLGAEVEVPEELL